MSTEDQNIESSGLDRRSMLKRTAIVGGALVWTTPIVQSIASPAFASTSPVVIVGCLPGQLTFISAAKFEQFDAAPPSFGTRVTLPGRDNGGTCFEVTQATPGVTPEAPADAIISVQETTTTSATIILKAGFTLVEMGVGIKTGEPECSQETVGAPTTNAEGNTVYVVTIPSGDISNILLVISGPC